MTVAVILWLVTKDCHKAYLGLVAAIEEAIEDASITLDRLKSETCKACSFSANNP